MEGYKSFREAVESVKDKAELWRYTLSGESFSYDELLEAAEGYDGCFKPDGWNYFVSFPEGELGILSTDDNEIVPLYLPIKENLQQKKPRFCNKCGARLRAESKFCPSCGKTV